MIKARSEILVSLEATIRLIWARLCWVPVPAPHNGAKLCDWACFTETQIHALRLKLKRKDRTLMIVAEKANEEPQESCILQLLYSVLSILPNAVEFSTPVMS